ncbi:MAG: LamG-like jellyroll fold domain-containing protein, partial [Rhodospirillales bacterium]
FKSDATTPTANDQTLIFLGAAAANQRANLHLNTDGTLDFSLFDDVSFPPTDDSYVDGEWHHAAVTYDSSISGGSDNIFLYVDGELKKSHEMSPDIQAGVAAIGNVDNGALGFQGQLDEARIWSEARSAEDIAEGYQQRLGDSVDTSNLEGYWRFDQVHEHGYAIDLSGHGNFAGIGHGAPADPYTPVMNFDGSTSDITTAAAPAISGSHSAEVWFKTTSTGTVVVMSTVDGNTDDRDYMQIRLDNGIVNMEVAGDTGFDVYTFNASDTLNDGEWHHVAYSYDVSTQTFATYLDGASYTNGSLTVNNDVGLFDPDGNFQIGTSRSGTQNFDGEISDVRLWDDIRTPTEIADHYDARLNGDETGLAAYYRLDKDGADSSANANDGTLTDVTRIDVSPMPIPFARAMAFDGTTDYVSINQSSDFQVDTTFAIEAWIKPDSFSDWGSILSNTYDQASVESGYTLGLTTGGGVRFAFAVDGVQTVFDAPASSLSLNQWSHVAATYDGAVVKIYVDGEEVLSQAHAGTVMDYSPVNDLKIGAYQDPNETHLFDGAIADVRLWDETRTVNQIRDGMTGYVAGNAPNLIGNWRLDDAAGTTVIDSAGNNNGTVVGDPQYVNGAAPVYSYEFSTDEDIAVNGSLLATDAETSSAALTFSLAQGADHGTVTIDADGEFSYTPAEDYSGNDSFRVLVSDGVATVTRTITVTVNDAGDAPEILGARTASGAMQFDGIDDYIQVAHADDLNPGTGSFSVQIMADFRDTTSLQSLISKGSNTSDIEGWNIFIQSGYLFVRMGNGGNDASNKAELRYDLTDVNGWHEVTFSLDRDAGTFDAYFDGTADGWTQTAGRDNDPSNWNVSNTDPLLMGKRTSDTGFADAAIDEVRIWNKALSASEVATNTNTELTGSETGLAAYWQFEADQIGQSAGTIADVTGNGHTAYPGALEPGDEAEPQFLIPPMQAMQFAGSDKIEIPDAPEFSTGTGDFSLEAWVYRTSTGTKDVIIDNRDEDSHGWLFGVDANNKATLTLSDANGGESEVFGASVIPMNQWVHLAVTADRDGVATFYLNGEADGTGQIDSAPGSLSAAGSLLIGNSDSTGTDWTGWNGMLSDVRIWNDVRDASEIGGDNFGHLAANQEGLVGNWRLDDPTSAGDANDFSGYENNGTITGAVSVFTGPALYNTEIGTDEDVTLTGKLAGVDADGDDISWAITHGPSNGTLTLLADGSFKYIPLKDFSGNDSFTATLTDDTGLKRTQVFTITVEEKMDTPTILGISTNDSVLQFDGANVLSAGRGTADALAITGDVTVEMWVNPSVLKQAHLLTFGSPAEVLSGNVLYGLEMQADGALRFFHEDTDLNNVTPTTSTAALTAGEWAHVAAVRDTGLGEVRFYVNGELFESIAYSGEADGGAASELLFGALDLPSEYEGMMDEVRVWDNVRTDREIADNYQLHLNEGQIAQATDLVGYWDFDDKIQDGGGYIDISGNGNDALIGRGVTDAAVAAHVAKHVNFDGIKDATGDNIIIPHDAAYDPISEQLSIEVWFRADEDGAGVQRIINKLYQTGFQSFSVVLDENGQLDLRTDVESFNAGPDLRDGQWHHAAVTFEEGTGNLNMYLDGSLILTDEIVSFPPFDSGPLMIGDFEDGNTFPQNFKGDIADVRIWDDIRTPQEIADNLVADLTGNEESLIGLWKLDDATDGMAADLSPTNNDGFLQNGAAFVDHTPLVVSVTGNAIDFDGVSTAVTMGDVDAFDGLSAMTVSAWVNPASLASSQVIASKWADGQFGYELGVTDEGNLYVLVSDNGTDVGDWEFVAALSENEWAHVTLTVDVSSGNPYVNAYRNGAQLELALNPYAPDIDSTTLSSTTAEFRIGAVESTGGALSNHFNGAIANVGVWSAVLSDDQIMQEMSGTLDKQSGTLLGYWPLNDGAGTEISDLSGNGNTGTITGADWVNTGPEIYTDQTHVLEGGLLRGNIGVKDGDAGETFSFEVTDDAHFGELIVDYATGAYS